MTFLVLVLLLLFLIGWSNTGIEAFDSFYNWGSCAPVRRPRVCDRDLAFATSNGTMKWLLGHPSYYQKYYHGYFPWATDDYSPYSPFDVESPYFFLN